MDIPAGRSAILYHTAKKHLRENYHDSYLMPNALKLPESITENAAEAVRTAPHLPDSGTLVISISSGTVAAGVLKGFEEAGLLRNYNVILHMGYSRSQDATREYIEKAAGLTLGDRIKFIDEGYGYADAAPVECPEPWPINPYYDKKALWWLMRNIREVPGPIVFWSIGD